MALHGTRLRSPRLPAHVPPSIVSTWPVMKAAAGLVRKSIAPATSAGVPRRPSAVRRAIRLGTASVTHVEVLDGLAEGDVVVIAGTDTFGDAERVQLND